MAQLFARKREVVTARQFRPGRKIPGVEMREIRIKRPEGKGFIVQPKRPTVCTSWGWCAVFDGDWVIEHADGEREVYPDWAFRLAFEPA